MFATIGRSWQLYKVCWRVLLHDKELLLFPLFSGISLILTIAVIFGSGLVGRLGDSVDEELAMTNADYVILGVFYFINYFIIIYFNAAIIGAARIRLQGGDPTLRDGFRAANSNLSGIIGWAAISAVVSLVFYAIDKFGRRQSGASGIIFMLLSTLLRVAWSVITYLVIPVLVAEKVGPIEAIKRSAALLKKTWGEQLVSNFGFDLMVIILAIPIVLVALAIAFIIPAPAGIIIAVAIAVVGLGLLMLVTAALRAIYIAALYEYATTGDLPQIFPRQLVADSWRPQYRTYTGEPSQGA
jgi:hypothetical protein